MASPAVPKKPDLRANREYMPGLDKQLELMDDAQRRLGDFIYQGKEQHQMYREIDKAFPELVRAAWARMGQGCRSRDDTEYHGLRRRRSLFGWYWSVVNTDID